jgi:hypothetical protein
MLKESESFEIDPESGAIPEEDLHQDVA